MSAEINGWAAFAGPTVNAGKDTSVPAPMVRLQPPSNLYAVRCALNTEHYALCPMPYVSNTGRKTEGELLEMAVAGLRYANQATENDPNLKYVMENIVNPKLCAAAGQDPAAMLEGLVPHLHSAVCEGTAEKVVQIEVARTGYALPGSWQGYWEKAEAAFVASLDAIEREVYEQTNGPTRTAFRICRDLASGNRGGFFLSQGNLHRRIVGLSNGWRILEQLRRIPAIRIVEKGEEWTTGKRPKATSFKWLLKDFSAEPPRRPGTAKAPTANSAALSKG